MDSIGTFICGCCEDGREGVKEEGGDGEVSVLGGVLVEVETGGDGKEALVGAILVDSICSFVTVSAVVEVGAGLENGGGSVRTE